MMREYQKHALAVRWKATRRLTPHGKPASARPRRSGRRALVAGLQPAQLDQARVDGTRGALVGARQRSHGRADVEAGNQALV